MEGKESETKTFETRPELSSHLSGRGDIIFVLFPSTHFHHSHHFFHFCFSPPLFVSSHSLNKPTPDCQSSSCQVGLLGRERGENCISVSRCFPRIAHREMYSLPHLSPVGFISSSSFFGFISISVKSDMSFQLPIFGCVAHANGGKKERQQQSEGIFSY